MIENDARNTLLNIRLYFAFGGSCVHPLHSDDNKGGKTCYKSNDMELSNCFFFRSEIKYFVILGAFWGMACNKYAKTEKLLNTYERQLGLDENSLGRCIFSKVFMVGTILPELPSEGQQAVMFGWGSSPLFLNNMYF